ncbi:MAG: hypothetical protein KIS96_06405 [Bauldia sp.]|nr:hypothetical protein [Bauldia sp.]
MKTIKASDIHLCELADDAAYRAAYDVLEDEFALVEALIEARAPGRAHARRRRPGQAGT